MPPATHAQGRKLNGSLPISYVDDVYDFALTPGGRVVHEAFFGSAWRVSSTPLNGSATAVLDASAPLAGVRDLTSSPDGQRAFWLSTPATNVPAELFGAPVNGSAPATRLHPPLTAGESLSSFHVAPNGNRIAYGASVWEVNASGDPVLRQRLFSVRSDGSESPVLLSTTTQFYPTVEYGITADSARLVYVSNKNNGRFELYSVPLAGGTPLLLHPPFASLRQVRSFALSADGTRAVYLADQDTDEVYELYSVPVDGSAAPVKLNAPLPSNRIVTEFHLTPDSTRVTYVAEDASGTPLLRVVPITGGTPLVLGSLGTGGSHEIAPDGTRAVLRVGGPGTLVRLFSVPLDGSAAPVELSGTIVSGGSVRGTLRFAADSSRVLYLADATVVGRIDLYSAPLDASAPAVRLNLAPASAHEVRTDFAVVGSTRVVFRMLESHPEAFASYAALYSAPLDGSAPAQRLSSDFPAVSFTGGVTAFALDPARGLAVYRGDQGFAGVFELYQVPLDGSAPDELLVGMRQHYNVTGDVLGLGVSPDGAYAVYLATEAEGRDLYAANLDGPLHRTRLDALHFPSFTGGWAFVVTPDSRRVVYSNTDLAVAEPYRQVQIHSVPLDGSAAAVTLTPVPILGDALWWATTPDSERVVFRYRRDADGVSDLYATSVDGSTSPLLLTPPGTVDGGVSRSALTPDGTQLVFIGARAGGVSELLRVPVDGTSLPVVLSAPLVTGGNVVDFVLAPDGTRVLYRADQDVDEQTELYSVALSGGSPVKLNAPLVTSGDVMQVAVSPDSSRAVYLADQEVNGRIELYSVPIAGGTVDELSAVTASTADVFAFLISADSSHVVYTADQDVNDHAELYSVPLQGGVPVKVSGALVPGGAVADFQLAGGRVVFRADALADEQVELFSAPLDGSAAPVLLSQPLGADRDVQGPFECDAGGQWVLFRADERANDVAELFATAIDGSRPVIAVNAPVLSTVPLVLAGTFVPGRARVLYIAEQDELGADELYITNVLIPPRIPPHRR